MEQSPFIATGVPQLDTILGGGIVERSLLLVAGLAGSGKTVLAAQIAFAAAQRDERVLFVTAFSEPHDKLISNLRQFQFFEQNSIGERIKLLNLQHQLTNSVSEAGETIVREARAHRAKLVVLDGFQGVSVTSASMFAPHQFLYDLNAKLSLLGITSLITFNYEPIQEAIRPELTAVDGIVWLMQEQVGDYALRLLQVVKQRGANPLLGRHSFKIDHMGVACFPRLEALTMLKDVPLGEGRAAFGIQELDAMLNGGITRSTNTIIAGAEGVGKTLLGLKFLMEGIAADERAILITFHETPQQLVTKGLRFGLNVQAALDQGKLRILHYPIAELNADMVAHELRMTVESAQIERLVIDGLYEIELPLIKTDRAHGFFASLITYLRSQQISACITLEIDPLIGRELSFVGKAFSALADNVLLMRRSESNGQLINSIGVLKMRFSSHDRLLHEYSIEDNGFAISAKPMLRPADKRRRAI